MSESSSERRLAENEVVFRQLNEQVKKSIDETNQLAADHGQPEYVITQGPKAPALHFYCECSDENCTKRVKINYTEYNEIHKNRDHFVVALGHEVPEIEHVVRKESGYNVVKKYEAPPETVGALRPTDVDNS